MNPTSNEIEKLDELMRQIMRIFQPQCIISGQLADDVHHIHGKGLGVRWHILNCVRLTRPIHNHTTQMHEAVKSWFINKYSLGAYEELCTLSKQPAFINYEEKKAELLEILEKLKGE